MKSRRPRRVPPTHSRRRVSRRTRKSLALVFTLVFGSAAARARAECVPFAEPPAISTAALGANAVVAADVDGDGDLDALSTSFLDSRVAWHELEGGSWALHTVTPTAANAVGLATADLNRDGAIDVAVVSTLASGKVVWYENDGAGGGWAPLTVADVSYATAIAAGDVDGDGSVDLVAAVGGADSIVWYENDGAGGGWTPHAVTNGASGASDVALADFDRDGHLDVLAGVSGSDELVWYENDGAGGGWLAHTVSATLASPPYTVATADVDGDGASDVLAAAYSTGEILWFRNDGAGGGWSVQTVATGSSEAKALVAADLDADGDRDLVGAIGGNSEVTWYENGGGWTPHTLSTAAIGVLGLFAGDLDGDGDDDLVVASSSADELSWYRNDRVHGEALFAPKQTVSTALDGEGALVLADVDRDGDLDAVTSSWGAKEIVFAENEGGGWSRHTVYSSAASAAPDVVAADLDGDGDLDALSSWFDSEIVLWNENDGSGGGWITHVVSTLVGEVYVAIAADLDGDGDLDVASGSAFLPQQIAWHENANDGDGTSWAFHTIASGDYSGGSSLAATDVDGDGELDLLVAWEFDHRLAWFENAGAGAAWNLHTIDSVADSARWVVAADLDRDGDPDALVAARDPNNMLLWYENDGSSTDWPVQLIATGSSGAQTVSAADLDGDGDLDALLTIRDAGDVIWYENDGSAGGWTPHVLSTNSGTVYSAAAGDLDGDGDLDAASLADVGSELAWYENRGTRIFICGFESELDPPAANLGCFSSFTP